MSRQQADRIGEQAEASNDRTDAMGGGDTSRSNAQEQQENPKRVQYGQGFSKDHPSRPGTDTNLRHSAGASGKETRRSSPKPPG